MPEFQTYNLKFGEDQLSGQYAQDPGKARRLENFIPSRAGDLKRKPFSPPFVSVSPLISAAPAWFSSAREYEFYVAGVKTQQIIFKVTNNVSTFLYKFVSGGSIAVLPNGAFDPPHNAANGWVGDPVLVYYEGLLLISDGESDSDWTVYDGTKTWKLGFDVPDPPTINLGGTSSPGSIGVEIFAEYVVTEFDDGSVSGRIHESPPSARVKFTPATPGTHDIQVDMPAGGAVNVAPGTGSDWTHGYPTHWRIYRSHIDGSTRLFRIATIPIASANFVDTIPMWGEAAATAMLPLEPPYRNHKPKPSSVATMMHGRMAMRDEDRLNRLWITGFAEVREQDPASTHAIETVPGVRNEDVELVNQSAFENFVEMPDDSFEIRSLLWWEEGLMMGTEHSVLFMWGSKPEDFLPANTATYSFGLFGRNAFLGTTHGLVMFTDDRKLVIDPAGGAGVGDRTAYVIDIGWEEQDRWDEVDQAFSNRFQMEHFQYGSERDWLVVTYTSQNQIDGGLAHMLIYDFETGGWITFTDIASTCVGIITEPQGFKFLVAGNSGADRQLKVVTDFDSSSSSPYDAAASRVGLPATGTVTEPACKLRTALLDMGEPALWKVWQKLSYFREGGFTVTVDVWFDPEDVENLGAADISLTLDPQLTSQEFQGWLWRFNKRAVFEFNIAAGGGTGALSGIEIKWLPKARFGT